MRWSVLSCALLSACSDLPTGTLSAGGWVVCVAAGEESDCQGIDMEARDGQQRVPRGDWVQLAPGFRHTCGLRRDGTVSCWGDSAFGQTEAPAGLFASVSVGTHTSCALDADGYATCWGTMQTWRGQDRPIQSPQEPFAKLALFDSGGCGIPVAGGRLRCWGQGARLRLPPQGQPFVDVAAGGDDVCALTATGILPCYGKPSPARGSYPFNEPMMAVAVMLDARCGLTTGGDLRCVGRPTLREGGRWDQIAAGLHFVCVSRAGPEVRCYDEQGEDVTPRAWR